MCMCKSKKLYSKSKKKILAKKNRLKIPTTKRKRIKKGKKKLQQNIIFNFLETFMRY